MKLKRIYIEISNICNLQCSFCAKSHRALKTMNIEEIKHILKQIKPYCEYVYLHIKGEPLLHPQFKEIIELLNQENMKLQLVTNGSLIEKYPDLIHQPCLRKISFSLHSIPFQKKEPLEYMQPILEFAKQASFNHKPAVELRFWNRNHLDEQSKTCLNFILNENDLMPTTKPNSYRWLDNVYVHFDEEFDWPSQANENDNIGFCQGARTMIGILSDGTVVPCCLDDQGIIDLGNIFTTPLDEILNSKRFISIREGFMQRKITEDLCRKCSYRHRFD